MSLVLSYTHGSSQSLLRSCSISYILITPLGFFFGSPCFLTGRMGFQYDPDHLLCRPDKLYCQDSCPGTKRRPEINDLCRHWCESLRSTCEKFHQSVILPRDFCFLVSERRKRETPCCPWRISSDCFCLFHLKFELLVYSIALIIILGDSLAIIFPLSPITFKLIGFAM